MVTRGGTYSAVRAGAALSCAAALLLWLVPPQTITFLLSEPTCCINSRCQCERNGRVCRCGHKQPGGWRTPAPECCKSATVLSSARPAVFPDRSNIGMMTPHQTEAPTLVAIVVSHAVAIPSQRGPPAFS